MATGDILSAYIDSTEANHWYVNVLIEGLSTGGTYDLGYGSDRKKEDAKFYLTRTVETFDSTGTPTTAQKTVYGTIQKRQAYPNEASADETVSGSDVYIRIALLEPIYAGDTNLLLYMESGVYTESSTPNNAVSGLSVTNNGTLGYFPVIANFSTPIHGRTVGLNELTGERDESGYLEVRVKAYHRDGFSGKPCSVVKITGTGQTSAYSTSVYVTDMTVDQPSYDDALPIAEYIGLLPTAGFTQGELVDIDFEAYPSIGDTAFSTVTQALTYFMPTSHAVTQTVICDRTGGYGTAVAVVDGTSGDDGTGVVTNITLFDDQNPPAAFATVGGAATAMRAYNNSNYSRDQYGGIIYMQAGSYAFTGGSVTGTTSPNYTVITPFPGVARSAVSITSQATDDAIGTYLMFNNITINSSSTTLVNGSAYVWFHKCNFVLTGTTQQYTVGIQYFTGNTISSLNQGFISYATRETYTFVRGNSISTISEYCLAHVVIGNRSTSGRITMYDYYTGKPLDKMTGIIVAENWLQLDTDARLVDMGTDDFGENLIGHAFVNNIFEKPTVGVSPLFWLSGDDSSIAARNNMIVWNNVMVGQRANVAYNDNILNGVGAAPRYGWSLKGNYFDDFNIVTDVDAHGGTPDGVRTGNHSIIHGCGLASNIYGESIGAAGDYLPDFPGLKSQKGTAVSPIDPLFVDNQSGSGSGGGNGDYHLQSGSPLWDIMFDQYVNYDLEGTLRQVDGSAGVYEMVSGINVPIFMNSYKQRRAA